MLLAARYNPSPYDRYLEPQITPTDILLWGLLAIGVVLLLGLIIRLRWVSLRPTMFKENPGVAALTRPGMLATRFDAARWATTFQGLLSKARQSLERLEGDGPRTALAALDEVATVGGNAAAAVREAALDACRTGALKTVFLKGRQHVAYVVVFPGRHEHSGLFRRYEPFADGWTNHVRQLRRTLPAAERALPLLCLLFFIRPDGGDGTLLIAAEGEKLRLVSEELIPATEADGVASIRHAERSEFQLA